MNYFPDDDEFQRAKRDEYVLPWYATFAEATLVDNDPEFRKLGVDTILIHKKTREVRNVEEKIVRWPEDGIAHTAFALETDSCTIPGFESPGWMVTSKADRLLYCFTQEQGWLECYWIDFKGLLTWFWPRVTEFHTFRNKKKNRSRGRVVPIDEAQLGVSMKSIRLGAG